MKSLLPLFLLLSLGFHQTSAGADPAEGQPARPSPLRIITYNVHGFGPVAAEDAGRERANRMRARGQLMQRFALELALYEPDVIVLQEAARETHVKKLAKLLGMHYAYFPGGWKGKGWEEGISGAILTRHEILERENRPGVDPEIPAEEVFSRFLGRVLIRVGKEELAIYGAHLLPTWENTTHIREAEIRALAVGVASDLERGRSVLVAGDMNHEPDSPEFRLWAEHGLRDLGAAAPTEAAETRTWPTIEPEHRIDYVFAAGPIAERESSARPLLEGAFRAYPSAPDSYALSDHLPVLATIR